MFLISEHLDSIHIEIDFFDIYGVFMYMRCPCPESQQPTTTFQYWSAALTATDRWRTGAWQLKDYCEKYIFLEFLPI